MRDLRVGVDRGPLRTVLSLQCEQLQWTNENCPVVLFSVGTSGRVYAPYSIAEW